MKILKLNLHNYKSFQSSGWLDFSPSFSVVIGKNNAGKSALLEAFRLIANPNQPHRTLSTPTALLEPQSSVDFEMMMSGDELKFTLMADVNPRHLPVPFVTDSGAPEQFALNLLERQSVTLKLKAAFQGGMSAHRYPSHGLFAQITDKISVRLQGNRAKQSVEAVSAHHGAENDDLPLMAQLAYPSRIYVFRAERLNIGRTTAVETYSLNPNGSNLAAVLGTLQGNAVWFERFNKHVTEILPSIRRVSVAMSGNEFEVRIWSVDPASEREDLAIPLEQSGTGVGQVLAILCVVMIVKSGVIVIDEPNSFLHPGAAKALIQVLKQYSQHQYVLATHSADLIATANPEIIHLVKWDGGESRVLGIDSTKVNDLREVLTEVGVSFSDLFGYDRAIWVEGPTEEICFPLILEKLLKRVEFGLIFLAVRNTGDFEKKRERKKLIWDIYEKLSAGALLLPTVVAFSFDREERGDKDIEDLKRQSKGRAHFISRLTYENYLIDPDAIAALINSLPRDGRSDITNEQVRQWLTDNCNSFGAGWNGDITDVAWLTKVHAPSLLKKLLNQLASAGDNFEKTSHSRFLTQWLIENRPEALADLVTHMRGLIEHTVRADL